MIKLLRVKWHKWTETFTHEWFCTSCHGNSLSLSFSLSFALKFGASHFPRRIHTQRNIDEEKNTDKADKFSAKLLLMTITTTTTTHLSTTSSSSARFTISISWTRKSYIFIEKRLVNMGRVINGKMVLWAGLLTI